MKEEKLKITFPDRNTIETAKNTVASELLKNINGQDSRVLAMRLNNKIYSLEKKIKYSGKIEPVFIDTKDGANIYRRPQRPLFKQITFYVAKNCRFIHLKKVTPVGLLKIKQYHYHNVFTGYFGIIVSRVMIQKSFCNACEIMILSKGSL